MTPLLAHSLTSAAHLLLRGTLESHGNTLSSSHGKALYRLCSTFTEYAAGKRKGRQVFPLPTGAGKTSALVAWTATLAHFKDLQGISVAVSASKVEALSKIKRALHEHGVPGELVGIKHSLPADSERILPSTGDEDRRIQLVTHQRVRGGTSHRLFTEHKGKPRTLMIYDEGLFRSDTIAISAAAVGWGIGGLSSVVGKKPELAGVIKYLQRCQALITAAVQRAGSSPATAGEVTLPALSELERMAFPELIRTVARQSRQHESGEALVELVSFSGSAMRVAVTPQGEGLLWHRIAVPEELENVLVLDASYPIRKLMQLDRTLTKASGEFQRDEQIKRFDDLTVHQMFAPGGRSSVGTSFLQERREKRSVSAEVVEVVKKLPVDEAVLIFVFKDAKGAIARNLRLDLREAGVDVEAKVTVRGKEKDRICVATWGSETSSNDYSHCRHVILAGVLHRSLLDIASAAVGQLDDRSARLDGKWLIDLMRSEVEHCVYQALSRGCCREVVNGQARPMDAYVILPWPLEPKLKDVLPGARYKVWLPVHGKGLGDSAAVQMAVSILDHLRKLPAGVRKVTTKAIKDALGVTEDKKMAFSRAAKQLEDLCPGEWERQGHSLVRVSLFAEAA